MDQEISLGFSPCPNDTFIFHALLHKRLETGGITFRPVIRDVEELNQMALKGELDVTKVSYYALGHILDDYCLLSSGGALGRGCGPIVVAADLTDMASLKGKRIAIPGKFTTAFLLLTLFDPALREFAVPMPFDRIMESVRDGEVDAGLIIHEGRFTYQRYGLAEVLDLGSWWEESSGLPIPLGGIVARRSLGKEMEGSLEGLIKESIESAQRRPGESLDYIREHAQELSDTVIRRHIELYVNDLSLDMGNDGRRAVKALLSDAQEKGLMPLSDLPVFCQAFN